MSASVCIQTDYCYSLNIGDFYYEAYDYSCNGANYTWNYWYNTTECSGDADFSTDDSSFWPTWPSYKIYINFIF